MLEEHRVRQVYLITYSQANEDIVSSRDAFANMVLEAFTTQTTAKPLHWVCSQEAHRDGGIHYHMAIKLNKVCRWLKTRKYLASERSIQVHFSDRHHDYYSAWTYVTKEDGDALQSPGHPDLEAGNVPRTSRASERHHEMGDEDNPKRRKKARLSAYEVSQIAVSRGIKTRLGLLALANQQKAAGKTDLAEFIVNRGRRVVNDAIEVHICLNHWGLRSRGWGCPTKYRGCVLGRVAQSGDGGGVGPHFEMYFIPLMFTNSGLE